MAVMVAFLNLIIMFSVVSTSKSLSLNYYSKTCPDVECIVAKAVKDATARDKTVPAALLRMHFHDCFVRVMTPPPSFPLDSSALFDALLNQIILSFFLYS